MGKRCTSAVIVIMSTFYHTVKKSHCDYVLVVQDDGKVAYAYLLLRDEIIGEVWLYNQHPSPHKPNWEDKARMPFLNPRAYVRPVRFDPLRSANDIEVIWHEKGNDLHHAEVRLRGEQFALLWPGSKPGCSLLAAKDGPVANVLVPVAGFPSGRRWPPCLPKRPL